MPNLQNSPSADAKTTHLPPAGTLCGVPLHQLDVVGLRNYFRNCLNGDTLRLVVTPNPEMLLASRSDLQLRTALRTADLALPDGFGLVAVGRLLHQQIRIRVAGVDAARLLLEEAAILGCSVYLLGGGDGVAATAAENLQTQIPGLQIAGVDGGGNIDDPEHPEPGILARIRSAHPGVLLVALGHGKQERLLYAHRADLPGVRVAIGVGGAFDYWSGRIPRAPRWLSDHGLEWLYRLWRQPSRFPRIIAAVCRFPYFALIDAHDQRSH
ncbi:MAG: WecB/TagA/CpsF family glycosyltransferase [bacterium]|nr:WecB/TagA/CpsF family glycosyltransferase [bacterium]